jgi:hypothetical protein
VNFGMPFTGGTEFRSTFGPNASAVARLGRAGKARENRGEDERTKLAEVICESSGRRVGVLGTVR